MTAPFGPRRYNDVSSVTGPVAALLLLLLLLLLLRKCWNGRVDRDVPVE